MQDPKGKSILFSGEYITSAINTLKYNIGRSFSEMENKEMAILEEVQMLKTIELLEPYSVNGISNDEFQMLITNRIPAPPIQEPLPPLEEHWSHMVLGLDGRDVKLVMEQTHSTREKAEDSLIRNGGDLVNAILDLLD